MLILFNISIFWKSNTSKIEFLKYKFSYKFIYHDQKIWQTLRAKYGNSRQLFQHF